MDMSFVCSIGNVSLAAVLWNGGISFSGVVAFIFADLLILPILTIYRRYYAGYLVELLFGVTGLIPGQRSATAAVLLVRFFRTGGRDMLRMMRGPISRSS
jgi:hypothetical protein